MEFNLYIRRPFVVEALEITEENIADIAQLVGTLRTKNGVNYISVDRRLVPNVNRAYVGWFMTRLGDNYRCYSPKVFNDQFINHKPVMSFVFDKTDEDSEGVYRLRSEDEIDDTIGE